MKTNKFWGILTMLILVLSTALTFSSCSSDEDEEESLEVYAYYYDLSRNGISYRDGSAIYFENDRCHITGLTDNADPSLYADWVRWKPLSGHPGWYVEDDQNHKVYSYVVKGSMIILSNGEILTKEGNHIYRDGTMFTRL